MAAAGRIIKGFSLPYVALYHNDNGNVTYTEGRKLARGVEISVEAETTEENNFYADNRVAESVPGIFNSGTLTLTVDGLFLESEKFIMGITSEGQISVGGKTVKTTDYGETMSIPYVGVGAIVQYQSEGVDSYEPILFTKARFNDTGIAARTMEGSIEWQTKELTATLLRDDTPTHNWKRIAESQATEAEAEAVIKAFLGIAEG